nr:uncharacterized protein LOC128696953 isoform X1 [Cherax quadricarinatus]
MMEEFVGCEDKVLHSGNDDTKFTCWRPFSLDSLPVVEGFSSYEEFHDIVRTVHMDDYREIRRIGKMKPYCLTKHTHTHLLKKLPDLCGLWYGISVPDDGQNNWYGNVSFTVNFRSFLQKIKNYNIYFMEVVDYSASNATRLLITNKMLPLPSYDPHSYGGPWYSQDGRDWFLTDCRRYDRKYNKYGHKVEFFLELSDHQRASLLDMSSVDPVNHSDANNNQTKHKCRKFGSGQKFNTGECPFPYSVEETREILISYDY